MKRFVVFTFLVVAFGMYSHVQAQSESLGFPISRGVFQWAASTELITAATNGDRRLAGTCRLNWALQCYLANWAWAMLTSRLRIPVPTADIRQMSAWSISDCSSPRFLCRT